MGESRRLEVLPVQGIGRIEPGDDLAAIIATAAPWLRDGDVVVVTSKIVSKAEGQLVAVPEDGPDRETVRAAVLEAETARVVASRGPTRIVATHHGFVMAQAGIDASNVDKDRLVLLPVDPDASAQRLRAEFAQRYGLNVAVIVSDTMGRPWRVGLVDVALGSAGVVPILDHRGTVDSYGNELTVTQVAVADELAAAAELVKGKLDEVPVAVVRGYLETPVDAPGAMTMIRDSESDLFSLGTAEARRAGMAQVARLPYVQDFAPAEFDPVVVADALAGVPLAPSTVVSLVATSGSRAVVLRCTASREPAHLVALGMDVHRLRAAFAGAGLATAIVSIEFDDEEISPDTETVAIAVGTPVS